MSLTSIMNHWRADPTVADHIHQWYSTPARPAQTQPFPQDLHPAIPGALHRRGIDALYRHQKETWDYVQAGQNVVVVTGTASGKSLGYNLPVLHHLLCQPDACSLYLFPTRALAQDQLAACQALISGLSGDNLPPIAPSIYDGDTPAYARPKIRTHTRLLITNPDMLHIGILPHHTAWSTFWSGLKFIVLDEIHTYRGVFGSHVANVFRRLKRIMNFYHSRPQFILTSATIANPLELAEKLVEEPFKLVEEDAAGRGPRHFLIYNPPVVNRDLGLRRSALQEGVRLATDLLDSHVQTILFARSRRTVEIMLTYLRQTQPLPAARQKEEQRPDATDQNAVRGYRAGYLPQQRRAIERGLRQGQVRAVVATNALELGIDIGNMGAAILVGYPGSIAAVRQQAGRAGRGDQPALALFIATADPLDQFLVSHPDYLLDRSPEQALINPDNLLILFNHIRCAAFELPFQVGDSYGRLQPEQLDELLLILNQQGEIHKSGNKYFWMADKYPAQGISLRSTSADPILLQVLDSQDAGAPEPKLTTIGETDPASARWLVHPQAIYLHEGQSYLVEELDLENHHAYLRPAATDYFTEPRRETQITLLEHIQQQAVPGGSKNIGDIEVTVQLTGYRMIKWYTHEVLGDGQVTLPPTQLQTTGYWITLSSDTIERLRDLGLWNNDPNDYGPNWRAQRDQARARDGYRCQVCGALEQNRAHDVHHRNPFRTFSSYIQANQLENLVTLCPTCHRRAETAVYMRSGLAGLAYILGQLAPLYLMCDSRDLGVHSDPQSPLSDGQPAIVLYDQVPAGIGFSQRLYEIHSQLVTHALEMVTNCPCTDGCPSCVGPGGENGLGGKPATLALLHALTATEIPLPSSPAPQ